MAKILLVEDDKSLREIYGVRLMAEGYEIVSAGDGEEALAMAIKERPDLIVSDVMMPKISGFDMLDILRSTSETKDVKVIMMTALSSDDQRARGEALGADRYLVKSQVGIEDVVRTVHDVLGDSIAAPAAPSFPPQSATPAPAMTTPTPEPVVSFDTPIAPVAPAAPAPEAVVAPVEPVAPAPVFEPAPAPQMQTPVMQPQMSQQPVAQPVAQPIAAPVYAPAVEPTTEQPTAPAYSPAPAASTTLSELPAAPVAPAPQQPIATQALVEAPLANPTPYQAPVVPAPAPAPIAPTPAPQPQPVQLPQPTAPFSSPAPASLGERVIEPLSTINTTPTENDIASQIEQALNGQAPPTGQPPVPPVA